ncbi:hypothetical protein Trco_006794 [Trichoderma cornu-damae]|uniref:Apolipoprotein/apolipophorin n=1 Tax=Trichoderma cornu-damae TaxID=654480 RepID=A0A9P8QM77_9HYPO|nr:hypothetical protein Trco_006794 [Trichoderma cornu-damae]
MNYARPAARLSLLIPKRRRRIRFQSTSSASSSSSGGAAANGSVGAGIAGGVAGAALFFGAYSFTPAGRAASKVNRAVKDAEKKYQEAAKRLQANAPSSAQAVDSIKQFAYSYVGWMPGGRDYVDAAFRDWETVRRAHGEEADKIVNDAYRRLQEISKSSLSIETASRAYDVLADLAKETANLAGDALSDVVDNHPRVREKLGGNIDQLKRMGERYGPEAKRQVDETWRQVEDIFAGGVSASSLAQARELMDDKARQVQKLGDEAWEKGLEEAKPYLEKSPRVKELLEKNADSLKTGRVGELFGKVRDAARTGDAGDLESYIEQAAQKAREEADEGGWGSLDKYLNKMPQGSEILGKLEEMGRIAEEQAEEGEKLLRETMGDIQKVLEEKGRKAREMADSRRKNG